MKLKILSLTAIALLSFSCSSPSGKSEKKNALAQLQAPEGRNIKGNVNFKETDKGIKVSAQLEGLTPNSVHGFHIHENGKCEGPDFKSAGGHFNPEEHDHAGPGAKHKHAGDMGNIVANKEGVARKEIFISKKDLEGMDLILNKAVILHSKADDLVSQPSGDAGDRIACGLIKTSKQ